MSFVGDLYNFAVRTPVRELFLHGPTAVGMWGGIPASNVCAHLTKVEASFWEKNPAECTSLIERECSGWIVLLCAAIYIYIIFRCLGNVVDRMTFKKVG